MRSPGILSLVLFIVFTICLFILFIGYADWLEGERQIQVLRVGWSGLVFTFLYLIFAGACCIISSVFFHLFQKRKKYKLPDTEETVAGRRLFLSQFVQGGVIFLSAGLTGNAWRNAAALPVAKVVPIQIKGLPEDLNGFRIVHLTDIHADIYTSCEWMDAIVGITKSLTPDLIAVTGDLADGWVERMTRIVSPLSRLSAPHGCYFVTGNHEYSMGAGGVEQWITHLKNLGFDVLLNEHRVITRGKGTVLIGGVTDFHAGYRVPDHTSLPSAAISGAPRVDVSVLLAHQPKSIYQAAEAGFDVQLSGHTHGGQIFPGHILMAITQPFLKGLHRYRNTQIYVNQGAGCWGPKFRSGSTAEIAAIVLSAV